MRFITLSTAVLLGASLSMAEAQQLRPSNPVAPPTKGTVVQVKTGNTSRPGRFTQGGTQNVSGANDSCGSATPIAGDGLFSGDNIGATLDMGGSQSCRLTSVSNVWYDWTAGSNGLATFSVCPDQGGSFAFDTVISVYDGAGCLGPQLACNDDACTGFGSTTAAVVTGGNVYKIQIAGWSAGEEGTYDLNIVTGALPVSADNCATPDSISGLGTFSFANAAATTGAEGQTEPLCFAFSTTGIDHDVWATWTAPSDGITIVSACGGTAVDTKFAAYDGAGCPAGAALACNDDTCGLQSSISFNATMGNSYTLQLGTFPGASGGTGNFIIDQPPPPGPCDVFHDGSTEDSVGVNVSSWYISWFHSQGQPNGVTVVNDVGTAWGSTGASVGPPNGSAARIFVLSDPNQDGNPGDAQVLGEIAVVVAGTGTDAIQSVSFNPPIVATGRYFIGAECTGGTFPAPLDTTGGSPGPGTVWIVGQSNGPANLNNLAGATIPPTDEDTVLPGKWLLTGVCKDPYTATAFCEGNAGCPCANDNDGSNDPAGCANATNAGGSRLDGTGLASLAGDTLVLDTTGSYNGFLSVFIQGDADQAAAPFGAGLRCVGGNLRKLFVVKTPVGDLADAPSAISIPPSPATVSGQSAASGDPLAGGSKRSYQVYYRDPLSAGPCGDATATFNITNGINVVWGP